MHESLYKLAYSWNLLRLPNKWSIITMKLQKKQRDVRTSQMSGWVLGPSPDIWCVHMNTLPCNQGYRDMDHLSGCYTPNWDGTIIEMRQKCELVCISEHIQPGMDSSQL